VGQIAQPSTNRHKVRVMQRLHLRPRYSTEWQTGFTLVEAMVVLAIVAILTGIAAPAYREMSERMAVSTVAQELSASIHQTRSTAIGNNGNVSIRKLTAAEAGLPGFCDTNQDWSCGWQVFFDANANGQLDAGDQIVNTSAVRGNVVIRRSVNSASMTANRWGQLAGIGAVGFTLSPRVTGIASPATTTICVGSGGRVRTLQGVVACAN
jgi:type IV fimbrial biogenesis protein FimT